MFITLRQALTTALLIGLYAPLAWSIAPQDAQRLDRFADRVLEKKDLVAGYPVNQDTDLDDFYSWYTRHHLYRGVMNNVGDPRHQSPYTLNTHEFENEVVDYFAGLYGFKPGAHWGFVTASGTDGNQHGVYFGRKHLQSKSDQAPVLYVSKEAHYSIKKIADVQNVELRLIQATAMGQMDMADFDRQLDPTRPALVVVAMGTTFKGAIDDQAAIRKLLREKQRAPYYMHLDAALFGGYLPYADGEGWKQVHQQIQKFDSIAVSGHKFFGFDDPMGIFITTQDTFNQLNPFRVEYLNDAVPTISCSRSAINPLKFWWKIHSRSRSAFRTDANAMLQGADDLLAQLQAIPIKAWKNPHSNTVFFEQPPADIMQRYDLAPENDARFGRVAHFIVMPHAAKLLEPFVRDMKGWKQNIRP
jgi:histidine decarboxylase